MNNQAKVSLVVATYNGAQFMTDLFESIKKQSLQPDEVIVVDNASKDETVSIIQQSYPKARLFPQDNNLDFACGYNLGMTLASNEWILIVNQDMVLEENAIERMVALLQSKEDVAAVAPKLLRILPDGMLSDIIDGVGLAADRKHQFINIGEGDRDQKDQNPHEVFGLSGAAILFKREALKQVAHDDNGQLDYFDSQFISYQEDIDLSYRFLHTGWKMMIEPNAIIYHKRTAQELKKSEGIRKDRQQKTFRVRGNSYRNHIWLLIKNEPLVNLIYFAPWILTYELTKLLFIIIFEPSTLKVLFSLVKGIPNMVQKRRSILKRSKISAKELRNWFIK